MSKRQETRNKGGRPRVDTEPVTLRLSREMIKAIDNERRRQDDVPTRPEAIRRLLEKALMK